ncbi:N6-adenosine-methyltransferase Ime4p [[Candida] anglica]|uniref:mRNA m(6)A methyltransferase n=1 Tax=[Candida] anglica TaxID=148631 RepID=A0ABP0E811_9ASCO
MNNLQPLVQFFSCKANDLTLEPLSLVTCIWHLYVTSSLAAKNESLNFQDFLDQIQRLNRITNGSLEFSIGLDTFDESDFKKPIPRLVWVDQTRIKILEKRLGNTDPLKIESGEVHETNRVTNPPDLLSLLKVPQNSVLSQMEEMISRKTAQSFLVKEKLRLKTVHKPFFEVCRNISHIQALTSLYVTPTGDVHKNASNEIKNRLQGEVYNCVSKKLHYLPLLSNYTDTSLGDCSYLDTCHRMKTCRYLHYYTLYPPSPINNDKKAKQNKIDECFANGYIIGDCFREYTREVTPAQWINCDVRSIPFSILGKFAVIISDPAWDIHMSLPYGTCKDTELLSLPMHELQDEGILLLWVTGRSIDTGRKALKNWGYSISDEIIWIKLNQLRRTIVTGRTGHWLNHSKEHLLVGVKGNPIWLNRLVDSNIVVSPTRETSRKPDEVYDIVERLVGKHARKLELFGRDHNVRPGWFTIGNQLQGTSIYEKEVQLKYDQYSQGLPKK